MRNLKTFRKHESGAIAVETALLMPILIFMFLKVFDIGLNVYTTQKMSKATKSGVQYVVNGGRVEDTVKNIIKDSYGQDISTDDIIVKAYCGCITKEDSDGDGDDSTVTDEHAGSYTKFETELSDNMCTSGCSSSNQISALVNVKFKQDVTGVLSSKTLASELQTRVQ